jgi:hypothetical protein
MKGCDSCNHGSLDYYELPAGHTAMFTMPDAVADLLSVLPMISDEKLRNLPMTARTDRILCGRLLVMTTFGRKA